MPLTLVLLRHAKSAYPDGVTDHDRPLAPRGIREAGLAGEWIRASVPPIDAVLCSTATRTRETLARTGVDAPVLYLDQLYDSTPGTVIDLINGVDGSFAGDVRTLLVVGHEPTTSQLALNLAGDRRGEVARQILEKYPTSSIAVLEPTTGWDRLELGNAALVAFHIPR